MYSSRFTKSVLLLFFVIGIVACGQGSQSTSGAASETGQGRQGELAPPAEPENALLELSYQGGMIANPDPTPFVRVYPGGQVIVHYPAYMKRAGDYTLDLDDDQLQALLVSFSNDSVLMLQPSDLALMTEKIQTNLDEPRTESHGVESVVRIRGESFTPIGSPRPAMLNVDQTIRASKDLLLGAEQSEFENLKSFAAGVQQLEALARSDSLKKIDTEE